MLANLLLLSESDDEATGTAAQTLTTKVQNLKTAEHGEQDLRDVMVGIVTQGILRADEKSLSLVALLIFSTSLTVQVAGATGAKLRHFGHCRRS